MSRCTICLVIEPVFHMHHTVPRSRGGENSKQIPLCSSCHNILHAEALSVVRRIKNGSRKPLRRFWDNNEKEERARPWLEILAQAMMNPPCGEREHLVSTSVSTTVFEELKMLQLDLGLSSQEKTLMYCIQNTLHQKGIPNVLSQSVRSKTDLWFMPVSGKG